MPTQVPIDFVTHRKSIFAAPTHLPLAHCISADLKTTPHTLANIFKLRFGKRKMLWKQLCLTKELFGTPKQKRAPCFPHLLILNHSRRKTIYYLITKRNFLAPPNYKALKLAIKEMAEHMKRNNYFEVAMPQLNCGPGSFEWKDVKNLIQEIFEEVFETDSSQNNSNKSISKITIHVFKPQRITCNAIY